MWIKSIFAGIVMTGLVFLFYKKILFVNKPDLFNVHYILGSKYDTGSGADIPGEIPFIIKKRINQLGYISVIRIVRNRRLDIQVENVNDTNSLRQAVTQNINYSRIEFREVYTLDELPDLFSAADIVTDQVSASFKRKDESIYSIFSPLVPDEINGQNVFPSAIGSANKKDTIVLNRVLHDPSVRKVLPEDVKFYFGKLTDANQLLNTPDDVHLYAIKTRGQPAILQNNNIESAEVVIEKYTGIAEILIKFDNNGRARWTKMTKDNINRYLAIILDDMVIMTPRIHGPMAGSYTRLSGVFTKDEADNLARQLRTSPLPAGLAVIKEEISPLNRSKAGSLIVVLLLTFVLTLGIAYLIFNSLKNS